MWLILANENVSRNDVFFTPAQKHWGVEHDSPYLAAILFTEVGVDVLMWTYQKARGSRMLAHHIEDIPGCCPVEEALWP